MGLFEARALASIAHPDPARVHAAVVRHAACMDEDPDIHLSVQYREETIQYLDMTFLAADPVAAERFFTDFVDGVVAGVVTELGPDAMHLERISVAPTQDVPDALIELFGHAVGEIQNLIVSPTRTRVREIAQLPPSVLGVLVERGVQEPPTRLVLPVVPCGGGRSGNRIEGGRFEVEAERVRSVVRELCVELAPQEWIAVGLGVRVDDWVDDAQAEEITRHHAIGRESVAVLPVPTPIDLVRFQRTSGPTDGIDNDAIVAALAAWGANDPLVVLGCGPTYVAIDFLRPPADPVALARDVYAICPEAWDADDPALDAIEDEELYDRLYDERAVEGLAATLRAGAPLYLWWD